MQCEPQESTEGSIRGPAVGGVRRAARPWSGWGTAFYGLVQGVLAIACAAAASGAVAQTVPGAPTIGTATAGNAQASVTFTAPSSNGGSPITGYTATSAPGGKTGSAAASPISVTGLTNGTAYTFTVTATNSVGTGAASSASNSVTPATVPGAPTMGAATRGNGQATVNFSPPSSNGGAAITSYTVTPSPGGRLVTGTASPITVTGLTNGTTYTFAVAATNRVGTGATSGLSNTVTPATVPGAPTIGAASGGNAQVSVAFTAPFSNGGSAITSYTATASPGGKSGTATASPVTVTGLTNGTAYTFTVTATNAVGTGAASAASSRVVPDAVPTVSISTPGNGATGSAPAAFSLSATASAGLSGETISSVQYFANGTAIGPALTASPYTYSWSEVDAGTYSLTAAATDNYGRVGVSAAVSVTVQAAAGSAQVYYIYADQIDTPRLIVRPSDNQVRWRWDGADPFGASQPNANPAGLGPFVYNARFPGQLYDPETGTHYNYFRNYDPAIARYGQSDPIGLAGGVNTYAYVGGNPLAFADPEGLARLKWVSGRWIDCGKGCRIRIDVKRHPDLRVKATSTFTSSFG